MNHQYSYDKKSQSYTGSAGSPNSPAPPPPYSRPGPSTQSSYFSPPQAISSFAPSPYHPSQHIFPDDDPRGWKAQMKNLAPGKSPAKLLEPPPPSFTRIPPPTLPYGDFPDMELIGKGTMLDQGFPYIAPYCAQMPHPFVTHDVNESDWRHFLHDIRIAGSLSPTNRIVSGVLPMAFGVGFIISLFATFGVEGYMRRRKKGPVSQLIDHWNALFFHPRLIHIALAKGPKDRHAKRGPPQATDKNWRLVISYRPHRGHAS